MSERLSLAQWKDLGASCPSAPFREVRRRVDALSPSARRAMLAWLADDTGVASAVAEGQGRPLGGVPCLHKDLFPLAGAPTGAGSPFFARLHPAATEDGVLPRAFSAAGAVGVGKTHLHAFAYGMTGENPHYGDVEHPAFPGRTSGGSSSGSAAAVAAGLVPLASGTDTGGSVRIPAAFCGLWGMRLGASHPWMKDAVPLAPSLDTPGWFTATRADMREVLASLVGLGSSNRPPRGCHLTLRDLGIAADPACARVLERAAEALCPAPDRDTLQSLARAFQGSVRAYAVLSSLEAFEVHRPWFQQHRAEYDPVVVRRLLRATAWSEEERRAAGVHRELLRICLGSFFQAYDFLVLPVSPFPALTRSECDDAHREAILALTAPASLTGLPVLTAPTALPNGLSLGLQIIVPSATSPVLSSILAQP